MRCAQAYQAATPFGSNVGPPNPAFYAISPETEFDSFLTIGMDGPALDPGALSSIVSTRPFLSSREQSLRLMPW